MDSVYKSSLDRLLSHLRDIESTNNPDAEHKVIERGPNAGEQAEGVYGLLPRTKDEIEGMSPGKYDSDEDYAQTLGDFVLKEAGGNEALAAGLWNRGHHYLSPNVPEALDPLTREDRIENVKQNVNYKKYHKLEPDEDQPTKFDNLLKLITNPKINKDGVDDGLQ